MCFSLIKAGFATIINTVMSEGPPDTMLPLHQMDITVQWVGEIKIENCGFSLPLSLLPS